MAVAISRVPGADHVAGNKKVKVRILTFSGTYPDNGETITPAQVGLRRIELVRVPPMAMAADGNSGVALSWDYTAGKLQALESAATGLALLEKTAAEAYPTGATARVEFIGV